VNAALASRGLSIVPPGAQFLYPMQWQTGPRTAMTIRLQSKKVDCRGLISMA